MTSSADYDEIASSLQALGPRTVGLVTDLLRSADIPVHSVAFRVKERESAERKISASGGKYQTFSDLHDLLGVRVITYFTDQVDAVSELVLAEFSIDPARSVDKRAELDSDRFGYSSRHFVGTISDLRSTLPEWRNHADATMEIQVRSILQHSWAEIEHDLGYKSTVAIPAELRRRFSRLAGVLELADDEFLAIRVALEGHATQAAADIKAGRSLQIDRDSVASLITESGAIRRLDERIASLANLELADDLEPRYASGRAQELVEVGFRSTSEVLARLKRDSTKIGDFAGRWLRRPSRNSPVLDSVSPGISLFYLYLHVATADLKVEPSSLRIFTDDEHDEIAAFLDLHREIFG